MFCAFVSQPSIMLRPVLLRTLASQVSSCSRGSYLLSSRTLNTLRPRSSHPSTAQTNGQVSPVGTNSDFSTTKFSMIYTLPHIKLLRVVSRLKLFQTTFTFVILPPVYGFYLQGDVPLSVVFYSTGLAVFAGVMLYTASHFIRRVVGMMYLDESQTTLKLSHLSFWGKRRDMYLPVSDVMTIADTGDSLKEVILKLKRYSSPHTMYFSIHLGKVVDRQSFEKVFGNIS